VRVHVEDDRVRAALKAARRDIDAGVKEGLRRAAERHGLPRARLLSPSSRIDRALRAGATRRTAFVEVRTRAVPFAGLLEFGGTRRDVIEPRRGRAVATPQGPRARVRNPRRYRGQRFMQRAVEQTLPAVLRDAEAALVTELEKHIDVT
jgi:hypothetical protein